MSLKRGQQVCSCELLRWQIHVANWCSRESKEKMSLHMPMRTEHTLIKSLLKQLTKVYLLTLSSEYRAKSSDGGKFCSQYGGPSLLPNAWRQVKPT